MARILISGGRRDPSIRCLIEAAQRRGLETTEICFDDRFEPALTWRVRTGELRIGGEPVSPDAAFIRYDVFSYARDRSSERLDHAAAWYTAVTGWCMAHPQVRLLNRAVHAGTAHKPYVLHLAAGFGVPIPDTVVSNDERAVREFGAAAIAKPVAGGAYCRELEQSVASAPWADGKSPIPALVQPRLAYPEYRVYRVGRTFIALEVNSRDLDYRVAKDTTVVQAPLERLGKKLIDGLRKLSDALGVDFGAFDLKTDAASGGLCLLELNTAPMFPAFDAACGGAITGAILDCLVPERTNVRRTAK